MFIHIIERYRKNERRVGNKPKTARSGEQNMADLFFKELGSLNVEGMGYLLLIYRTLKDFFINFKTRYIFQ